MQCLIAGVAVAVNSSSVNRRQTLNRAAAILLISALQQVEAVGAEVEYVPATIQPNLAPSQGTFDATDEDLRDAAALLQRALNAEEVEVPGLKLCRFRPLQHLI